MELDSFHVSWLFLERPMASVNAKLCQLSLGSSRKAVGTKREVQFPPGEKDRERRSRCPEPGSRGQLCKLPRREAQEYTDGTTLLSPSHACFHPTEGPTQYLVLPGTIYWWGQRPLIESFNKYVLRTYSARHVPGL